MYSTSTIDIRISLFGLCIKLCQHQFNMQKLFGYYFRSNEVTDSLLCGGCLHQGGDQQNKAGQGEQAELLLVVLEWFGGG